MKKLLRIGAFAKLGGVTVKALRFYDQERLLRPDHVDTGTGYRLYALSQLEPLAVITNLRAAGFAISEIRELVRDGDGPDAIARALRVQRERLLQEQGEIIRRLRIVDALARSAGRGAASNEAIRLVRLAPRLAHTIKKSVRREGPEISAMFEAAETAVARCDARAPEAPFLIFHEQGDAALDVEACIPVLRTAPQALSQRLVPGAPEACSLLYSGSYEQTGPLQAKMNEWIAQAGLRPSGPLREVYHRFGADEDQYQIPKSMLAASHGDYLTELQIPIAHP